MATAIAEQDPKTQAPQSPGEGEVKQQTPGLSADMHFQPDYGEKSYVGSGRLAGRKAIITGGDSGIGRAVALAFAREGADVLISYYNEDEDAQETRRLVEDAGRKAVLVPGDITDERQCKAIVQTASEEFGRIDILVNNAAFQMTHKSIADVPSDEWDHTFRTNVYATFYLCKAALPHMKEGSSIINTTSIQAFKPSPTLLAYATTKAALYNFTKALAAEVIEKGIRVNAVAPGPIWTPLIASTMPEEELKSFGKAVPMQRAGQPAELAHSYVFLASSESSYSTGQVIGVTGGEPLA